MYIYNATVALYDTWKRYNTVKVHGAKSSHKESSVKAACRGASRVFERTTASPLTLFGQLSVIVTDQSNMFLRYSTRGCLRGKIPRGEISVRQPLSQSLILACRSWSMFVHVSVCSIRPTACC